jgi:hypothetical protein
MARLPRTGSSLGSLCERTPAFEQMVAAGLVDACEATTTLTEVFGELGLAPLSDEDEQKIRDELGFVIGRGYEIQKDSQKQSPTSRLTVVDVREKLERVSSGLEAMADGHPDPGELAVIERVLNGSKTGFRESHDIAVALRVIKELADENGHDRARELVIEFRKWPRTVAEACRTAAKNLNLIKGKSGKPPRDWYRDFKRVLTFVAEKNGIRPMVVINWRTQEAQGRFIDLAERFEQLLPGHMRSPNRQAIAKMLQRTKT